MGFYFFVYYRKRLVTGDWRDNYRVQTCRENDKIVQIDFQRQELQSSDEKEEETERDRKTEQKRRENVLY